MIIDKIKKVNKIEEKPIKNDEASEKMIGKWVKCNNCKEILYKEDLKSNYSICPNCGKYFRLSARRRIKQIIDEGTFEEIDADMRTSDLLKFEGYKEKIQALQEKTKIQEAIQTGTGNINGLKVAIGVMDSNFMMGSMGSVVGEKVTRAVEYATAHELPIIIFTTSGGARMQEGIISLMQMAKVSEALGRHDAAGLLYVTVLTDPTTGGVTASFAMLGDIILAEPKALIGFAGQRVIQGTIHQKLPEGFQRAEFQLKNGFVDRIVHREKMREELGRILKLHSRK